ncbi:carboxymuconolactone decarboxylase family protein [Nocardia higoensis]|uniref:Carboxymuconolactone decarboxylase family protein n=1 Tax=Nocardia higoensis TaxID=228599 RepID=A0ABS0DB57_9NOCA|nr:carboxymuconolactone decarboxylase family protein [Nocardia higoensis]MBF6355695.1 carboxymuconolactone decarboxylase family protein [Nocardia higoensis]
MNWIDGARVWFRRQMDRKTREAIMLAVSHAHDCRYCTFVHREWALYTGIPLSAISEIESRENDHLDQRIQDTCGSPHDPIWLATTYAEALVRAEFGSVAPFLQATVTVRFDSRDRTHIETVARIITILNRSTNTIDALSARLHGHRVDDSRVSDEILVAVFAWAIVLPMFAAVALFNRESPHLVLQRFRQAGLRGRAR